MRQTICMTDDQFVPIALSDIESVESARFGEQVELTPYFSRRPHSFWCLFFQEQWDALDEVPWLTAGFVRCDAADEKRTTELLAVVTERANALMSTHLPRLRAEDPEGVSEFLSLDGSLAASAPGRYMWRATP